MGCKKSKPNPPGPPPTPPDEIKGYYSYNWGTGSYGPEGANVGVAFTGHVDVATAISLYVFGAAWCCPDLVPSYLGKPYITIGGGEGDDKAGVFTLDAINRVKDNLDKITDDYSGVIFDIEVAEGDNSASLVKAFEETFIAAKNLNLQVGVTTCHTAPYLTDTPQIAVDLVKSWVQSDYIDFISPQLYDDSGSGDKPDFEETGHC